MWMAPDDLAGALRALREKQGRSMAAAGAAVGLSQTTMHRYETGKVEIPYDVLAALASLYGVGPAQLLGGAPAARSSRAQCWQLEQEVAAYKRRTAALEARLRGVTVGNCYDVDCLLRGNHEGTHYDGQRRYYAAPEGTTDDG